MTSHYTETPFYMRVTYSEVTENEEFGPVINVEIMGEDLAAVRAKIKQIELAPERDILGDKPNGNFCIFTAPKLCSCRFAGQPVDYWRTTGFYTVGDTEPRDPPGWEGGFADNH